MHTLTRKDLETKLQKAQQQLQQAQYELEATHDPYQRKRIKDLVELIEAEIDDIQRQLKTIKI